MRWILPDAGVRSKAWVAVAFALATASCEDHAALTQPINSLLCYETLCVALPIAAKDTAFAAYGIWPFGVHGADHALDGHPGWDIEYKVGGEAIAAETGTVLSLFSDTSTSTTTVQLSHTFKGKNYRTVYTSLSTVASGVTVGAAITRGQVLGVPRVQTRMIGTRNVTYAAIHFQFDDFSSHLGSTNVNAVNPHLVAESLELFRAMWAKTGYTQELCEPMLSNSRLQMPPITRRWTIKGGISFIDVTCQNSPTQPFLYAVKEPIDVNAGTLLVNPLAGGTAEIDFNIGGTVQRGLYRIISDTMWLQLSAVGAPRPASLSAPVVYVTH